MPKKERDILKMLETPAEVMEVAKAFFEENGGKLVDVKKLRPWVTHRQPDFIGLLKDTLFIGETKTSKELRGNRKLDGNKISYICYYDDVGEDIPEINKWFEKRDCIHDPKCFRGKMGYHESSYIRHVIADFIEKKKVELGLKDEQINLVRFFLFTFLSQIPCYFYRFLYGELLKERLKKKLNFHDFMDCYKKNGKVKGMLVIPAEFENELEKTREILESSQFKKFINTKISNYLLKSVEVKPKFQNILVAEISYEMYA